jgi:hypothetical protein
MLGRHRKEQGAERLRKPEGASESDGGKVGQTPREFLTGLEE